ncbi:MAG: DUF6472 family protein [Lachnospiraceae bacterium]|nr:DUF6472 family protein [Lachnospiraceae bacterium]
MSQCDTCSNYVYDEEYDDYMCMVDIDEDEMARSFTDSHYSCAYYSYDNEYDVVKHQM